MGWGRCHSYYKTNLSLQLNWHWTCQLELSLAKSNQEPLKKFIVGDPQLIWWRFTAYIYMVVQTRFRVQLGFKLNNELKLLHDDSFPTFPPYRYHPDYSSESGYTVYATGELLFQLVPWSTFSDVHYLWVMCGYLKQDPAKQFHRIKTYKWKHNWESLFLGRAVARASISGFFLLSACLPVSF